MIEKNLHSSWHEYKRLRNRCLLIFIGGMPTAVLIGILFPAVFSIAAATWFIGSIWSSMLLSYFKCPRCGKPFITNQSLGYNGFTRKCLNCGLPKWSEPTDKEKT